ncbi:MULTISPECIES: hypothetical protein [Streptomyces]|uniref:hypothetical protein n=1 Tax=Streptomyces TaxID=1883 RepID=UPI00131DEFF3|nr:hypothetical protein [Streptomyces sp. NRRL F-5527]
MRKTDSDGSDACAWFYRGSLAVRAGWGRITERTVDKHAENLRAKLVGEAG